jgi:hypothetical protein
MPLGSRGRYASESFDFNGFQLSPDHAPAQEMAGPVQVRMQKAIHKIADALGIGDGKPSAGPDR